MRRTRTEAFDAYLDAITIANDHDAATFVGGMPALRRLHGTLSSLVLRRASGPFSTTARARSGAVRRLRSLSGGGETCG
jgi:hypothetical protein